MNATLENTNQNLGELTPYLAPTLLADADHPRVIAATARVIAGAKTDAEKAERLVRFVAEEIGFGLPPSGDQTSASRTLELGYGHSTARATLLIAMARAAGIPARIHGARFGKSLVRELVPGYLFALLPETVPTAWAELYVGGRWEARPDAGSDADFTRAAQEHLEEKGLEYGAGLLVGKKQGRAAWASQLARLPLAADDGTFRDTIEYLWSEEYPMPRSNPIVAWVLGPWGRQEIDRRIEQIRQAVTSERAAA